MACSLQRLSITHQEPFFGATADTHHDSGRGSQPQSTGTSDDKHRDGGNKAVLPAICRTKEAPRDEGQDGDKDDHGHEDSSHSIHDLLNRCA